MIIEEQTFTTSAHAKCILAGEHAVIKGCPAIVFPVKQKMLTLEFKKSDQAINFDYALSSIPYEQTFLLFFWEALERCLSLVRNHNDDIKGSIAVKNNIPMGAGIGFSSALCVVLAKWFAWQRIIAEDKIFHFAKSLEDLFHGKSSGVDVAGVLANKILHYEISGNSHFVTNQWHPKLYLSYSGQPKNTSHAVHQVLSFRKAHAQLAKMLDREMQQSVMQIEQALQSDPSHGLVLLASALMLANHCFIEWELVTPTLQQHMTYLLNLGAIAVKPTGAGEGGYVLSLWEEEPPHTISEKWIPLF